MERIKIGLKKIIRINVYFFIVHICLIKFSVIYLKGVKPEDLTLRTYILPRK